jgi:NAD(P)-dependent dehydrogenase (short-subunit alcohol dehydrogenase family)
MKVLVIGASGKSGEALVNEALAVGHKVTAFVRDAAQYKKANVRVFAGDVLDAAAVDLAVAGQDAVIDALGGKTPWKVTTMETNAAHNIVDAMRRNGVRRLLKISVVGAGESIKNAGFFNEHLLMRTFLRGLLVDKAGMEAEIEGSNLDADVDPRRKDRHCQGAEHGGRREGVQDRAGRPGSVHGAATGKQPVCASGSDSDDHIARPRRGSTASLIEANPIDCVKACNDSCDR